LRRLRLKASWARQTVLEMAVQADSGHVTTAFSLAELFTALYHGGILRFNPREPRWEGRDRFILSEGQAGIGLYPFLADVGFLSPELLINFTGPGSTLGVHAEPSTPGIEVLTGSPGWGPSIGTGMAQAAKLQGADWRVLVLTGDGELTEGSCDEAFRNMFNLRLDNLTVLVNRNHLFTIGYNDRRELQRDLELEDLVAKFEAYHFEVREIDGHSFEAIFDAFADFRTRQGGKPLAIIAHTEKGHGCTLANRRGWHYRVPKFGIDPESAGNGRPGRDLEEVWHRPRVGRGPHHPGLLLRAGPQLPKLWRGPGPRRTRRAGPHGSETPTDDIYA
jgi:transketolase